MLRAERHIDTEKLRECLSYDPQTGHLTWVKHFHSYFVGKRAGTARTPVGKRQYRNIGFGGRQYFEHRIIWFLVYGSWPDGDVDHINGDGSDNRLCNLRVVTRSQNMHNCHLGSNNTSGYTGVFLRPSGRWRAKITVNRKQICLGTFDTKEDAHAAYLQASIEKVGLINRMLL